MLTIQHLQLSCLQCNVARPTSGMSSLYRFGLMPGKGFGFMPGKGFGLMPGKGTADDIFIMRKVEEKHQAKKKKMLYYAFVYLEKEFDKIPREVVRLVLRKRGMDEWLTRTVMVLYPEACIVV